MKIIRRIMRYGLLLLGVVLLTVIVINLWVVWSASGLIYEDTGEVPESRVALLLGTSRNVAGHPNIFFFKRIEAAAALYRHGKVRKIIVSGDNGSANYNETDDMRRELVLRGVPERDIVNDHAGFRTLDSVLRARDVFGQDSIVVVSQRFHVQRAIFIAHAHGIAATGFVAGDPPHGSPYFKVLFREYFARVKAFLDCYLLGTKPRFPGPPEPIEFH